MERSPKYPIYRYRSRCVSIAATLIFWWALLMVPYSFDRRPPPIQSTIGQPLLSLYTQEFNAASSISRGLSRGLSSEGESQQDDDQCVDMAKQYVDMTASTEDCEGRYIYVYELDPYFNEDMVKRCNKLSLWTNWCPSVRNAGLGPPMANTDGVFSDSDWYTTNQFMLEQIFHNRMRRYKCLTKDSNLAAAVFVPFYAGFEITTKLWRANITERDAAPNRLLYWLSQQPEWKKFGGMDHFLVGGRITWDFRRSSDEESDWGNKLFVLPASANMTMLTIEASPWHGNDVAIPYPTYFHPSSKQAIELWQKRMQTMERGALFSFVGAPRPGLSHSIRGKIISQCVKSRRCRLLDCKVTVCLKPHKVMAVFEHSVFCLQPAGDSYTRRSTFDAMLAGCIPVFFHHHSAYDQYQWHLPSNHSSYSVLIAEGGIKNDTVRIEDVLGAFSAEQVASMRETVIQTIPRIVYADPRTSPIADVEDAFDITVQGVIDRIHKRKRDTWHVDVASPSREEMIQEQVATEGAMQQKSDEGIRWREHNRIVHG